MRITELLRLVWLNINQNKFKAVMTSIGIVVGAATIMLVLGIGRGGQMDIAEQFAELNAGEINVSYEYEEETTNGRVPGGGQGGFPGGDMFGFGGGMPGGGSFGSSSGESSQGGFPGGGFSFQGGSDSSEDGGLSQGGFPGGGFSFPGGSGSSEDGGSSQGGFPGGNEMPDMGSGEASDQGTDAGSDNTTDESDLDKQAGDQTEAQTEEQENEEIVEENLVEDRLNQEKIIFTQDDVDDINISVSDISGATISYTVRCSIEGGNFTSAQTYTVAGVKEAFADISKLQLAEGSFINQAQCDSNKRVCVLGATVAKEMFGSAEKAMDQTVYIDDRTYTVCGVGNAADTVSCGISLDTAIFIPYETGIKFITGKEISPKITVIAKNVDTLQDVIANVKKLLNSKYNNVELTFEDSGSKMKAAESSNRILTLLLFAMAAIVFIVGGIGIMNVLFVSVKERTNEIGILKAIGTAKKYILLEFLFESAAISMIGGILGIILGFAITPIVRYFGVRVEIIVSSCMIAVGFAVLTGTIFGIYHAWKASKLEPVDALNAE